MSVHAVPPHSAQPVAEPPVAEPTGGPILLVMLIAAIGLPSIGTTIIIPSLPQIAVDFATDAGTVTLTQTFYMIGLALPQLVYGAVSDRIGRRPTMLAGMALAMLGSLICAIAPNIEMLTAGRLCQAVGSCAGIALGRAILRDLYPREKAASNLAYITMAMAAGPSLAPLVGGLIQEHVGWRAIFGVMMAAGAVTFLLCWRFLPETNRAGREKPRWASLAAGFVTLLRHRQYRLYAIPPVALTATYQGTLVTCSFIAAIYFPMSPVAIGFWLLTTIAGFSFGNFLSGRFSRHVGIDQMIRFGSYVNLATVFALPLLLVCGWFNHYAFFAVLTIMNIGHGFALTNGVASATGVIPGLIGSAAGLMGFLQMTAAAIFSIAVGMLIDVSIWFLFAGLIALGVASLVASLLTGAGPTRSGRVA
jgi:DHA1 family bicyclomycin/chloramphenicol resistance-like MFS transporter